MITLKNSSEGYGLIAILLHWIIAILIIGMLILGLYMVRMPISIEKLKFYGWHKEFGVLVLELAMLRLFWRLFNVSPGLPLTMPAYQKFAAKSAHWAFYIFMFAMPISGWMMSSSAGLSVSFFGLFLLPNLVGPNPALHHYLALMHQYLAYSLIALIALHTTAALEHHFIKKDDVLRRMLK